jgi:hypothetical protein
MYDKDTYRLGTVCAAADEVCRKQENASQNLLFFGTLLAIFETLHPKKYRHYSWILGLDRAA